MLKDPDNQRLLHKLGTDHDRGSLLINYNFLNPNVPWGFPKQIDLTDVSGSVSGQDSKGIKLGDVVSTWANPANFGNGEPLVFDVQDRLTLQFSTPFFI